MVVDVGGRNRRMHLLTSVTDPAVLSDDDVIRLYTLRWGVELYYRSLKQTMRRQKLKAGSPLVARAELDWATVALWLLTLMGTDAIGRRGDYPPRTLSVAAALRLVTHAAALRLVTHAAGHPTRRAGPCGLERQLFRATLDSYKRLGSKRAREWAHRKRPKPPGNPKARTANESEIELSKRFRAGRPAA